MRRFLAIVSVVASGLGAAGAGDQDYFLSVPSQGAIHRVDAVTLQATPFLTGLNTPFYGFHDASGNLYIPDHLFGAILRIDPLGIPSLLTAGGYLTAPLALIADPTGASWQRTSIKTPSSTSTTLAIRLSCTTTSRRTAYCSALQGSISISPAISTSRTTPATRSCASIPRTNSRCGATRR